MHYYWLWSHISDLKTCFFSVFFFFLVTMSPVSYVLFLFLCKLYFKQHNTLHIDQYSQKWQGFSLLVAAYFSIVHMVYDLLFCHPLKTILAFSILLVWIISQWTWKYRCLFHILISVPLSIFPEISFLDHMVVLFLVGFFLERFTYHFT